MVSFGGGGACWIGVGGNKVRLEIVYAGHLLCAQYMRMETKAHGFE